MKYILLFIFISSAVICNAQTQRIKDLISQGGDINASQYPKAKEGRTNPSYTLTYVSETFLLYLNGQPRIIKAPLSLLQFIVPQQISCMDIITDEQKIADYTKDASIKKVIIIETKE
ncbi:MAG TPA: hypothetical protein VK173_00630 [Lacibacter sp.]|nr:hypothetical protein [Lacibacter sp.]